MYPTSRGLGCAHHLEVKIGIMDKAAKALIEAVRAAGGVMFEPTKMKRLAKAEVAVDKIKAQGMRDLAALDQTDTHPIAWRREHQEERRQRNINTIISGALPDLTEKANPQDIDEDWLVHYLNKCADISNEQMQQLWSKILAGEANKPGQFSKRTIDFVTSMNQLDAGMFRSLCQCSWQIARDLSATKEHIPFIFEPDTNSRRSYLTGLRYDRLVHLEAIGLITNNIAGSYELEITLETCLFYQHTIYQATPNPRSWDRAELRPG